jgi:hypothetical protein
MSEALLNLLKTEPLRKIAPSVWYPGYMPGLSDLLVMRMPPALHHQSLTGLNREMRVLFVENETDRKWALRCLDRPVDVQGQAVNFRVGIDKINMRPSTLPRSDQAGVLLYVPPEPDWPHFVLTVLSKNAPDAGLARQRYGWDAFPDEASAQDHMVKMAAFSTKQGFAPEIRMPDPKQRS